MAQHQFCDTTNNRVTPVLSPTNADSYHSWTVDNLSYKGNLYNCDSGPLIKIFYKNSKDVGMAQKVQKQLKAVTQSSINHGPYMQECGTL